MFGDTSPLQGWTPLHLAALYGDHAEVAQLLLQHLADVNAQTDQCRNALRARPPPHGLRPLLPPLDRRGLTPLHYAAFKGHSKVAQLLVDANASPDSRYNSGPGVVSRTMCLGLRAWQQWFFVWFRRFNSFLFFNWGSKGFWKAGSGLKTWWVENIQRANRMPCKEILEASGRLSLCHTPLAMASKEGQTDVVKILRKTTEVPCWQKVEAMVFLRVTISQDILYIGMVGTGFVQNIRYHCCLGFEWK